MKIIQKIAQAKALIKSEPLKKGGKNDFAKYDYFTPSQVESLVNKACEDCNILTKFDLIRNELGVSGVLTVFDIETGENIQYTMATAIPEIKATNISQQLGGCVTYTERYLKMTAFGITDNRLDFDTTENTTNRVKRLEKACKEMNNAKSLEELKDIWTKYNDLQSDSEFLNAKEFNKNLLTNK